MRLTDSLEALVVEHDRIGSPLRSRLEPGRTTADVEGALGAVGLAPSDEIIEFFGWHEIRDEPGDRSRLDWFWPAAPYRLEEAIQHYGLNCSIGDGALTLAQFDELARAPRHPDDTFTGFWREDWLPLFYGGEDYAAVCGMASAERPVASPMWRVLFHPDAPTMQLETSLTAFIDRVIEMFRLGAYEWNAEYQSVEPITAVFEGAGLDYNARPWPG
jgi:hypothetical protein